MLCRNVLLFFSIGRCLAVKQFKMERLLFEGSSCQGKFSYKVIQIRVSNCQTAGLKCRSQVTGQVTGHRLQVRPQVRSQVTHKNSRTREKTVLD